MTDTSIYRDIASRTGGDIYIGVVGPVRTGKSTFIKRFMEELVLPNIAEHPLRVRAEDEMPQSATGRTVMTTEPTFVPEQAVDIRLYDGPGPGFRVKMIDCVGYLVDEALGSEEDGKPRMVRTPWSEEPMPFAEAAAIGTEKVIREHATVGVAVTTDGSIGDIPRAAYEEAEERVVKELKTLRKPFALVLNSAHPERKETMELAMALEEKYGVPVALVNCLELNGEDIRQILKLILDEFPLVEVRVKLPRWLLALEESHWLRKTVLDALEEAMKGLNKVGDAAEGLAKLRECEQIEDVSLGESDLGRGSIMMEVKMDDGLYYRVLSDLTGLDVDGEEALMALMREFAGSKKRLEKLEKALDDVYEGGYGIVMPEIEEMRLEEPEVVKTAGSFGVKIRAAGPSIHLIRADIETELNPSVGSEEQSEDMVRYLRDEYSEDPGRIWACNMFGKSLHEMTAEGLYGKLDNIPEEARLKLRETLERILNEGANGLICVLL